MDELIANLHEWGTVDDFPQAYSIRHVQNHLLLIADTVDLLRQQIADLQAACDQKQEIIDSFTVLDKARGDAEYLLRQRVKELEAECIHWANDADRMLKTIRYLIGIAERGEGRPILDNEKCESFVLGYVKRIEAERDAAVKEAGLMRAVNRAANELPNEYELTISVERGAAWVCLYEYKSNSSMDIDGADKTLAEQVDEAIDAARSAEQGGSDNG